LGVTHAKFPDYVIACIGLSLYFSIINQVIEIGMIPGTVAYVFIGTSASGI